MWRMSLLENHTRISGVMSGVMRLQSENLFSSCSEGKSFLYCTLKFCVRMRLLKTKNKTWSAFERKIEGFITIIQCHDGISLPASISLFSLSSLFSFFHFLLSFPFISFHTFLLFLPSSFLFLSQHYTSNVTHRALINFPDESRKILHIFPTKKWQVLKEKKKNDSS